MRRHPTLHARVRVALLGGPALALALGCGGSAARSGSTAAPPVAVKTMPAIPDLSKVRTFTQPIPELPRDKSGMTPASLVRLGTLEHPESAWNSGLQGWAVYDFVVDADGRVNPKYVRLVRASHDVFATPAKAAVLAATFSPATQGGKAVASLVRLPVYFSLEQAGKGR